MTAQTDPRPAPLPFVTRVSGISNYQDVARGCREGDPVTVTRDPGNPYDRNACQVRTSAGALLGFVPRTVAARLVARGEHAWTGTVTEVLRGDVWGVRVKVADVGAPPPAADSGGEPAETPPAGEPARVFALSGRQLGTLVGPADGTTVTVRADDGTERLYPAVVVRVTG